MTNDLLFGLIILGGLTNPSNGTLWLCKDLDYYIVELTLPQNRITTNAQNNSNRREPILLLDILPKISCLSPRESLAALENNPEASGLREIENLLGCWTMGLDQGKYESSQYQRPYKRLFFVSYQFAIFVRF